MAFKRQAQLDVGINNNLGVRISSLLFNFEIERSVEQENNYARINVYNAKKETRDKILIKDNNIFLKAGYEDENNLSLIFFGVIQQSTSRFENTEYITEIFASDFGSTQSNIKKQIVNFNYNSGISYSTIINDIATIINIPIIGLENISSIILNNGFIFHGTLLNSIKQLQKKLKSYNIGLYFDLGEMVIYNTDTTPTQFGIVDISPRSGLIGEVEEIIDEEDKDAKRISFRTLLNPKLNPNTVVRVSSEKVSGAFVVQKVIFRGGNIQTEEFIVEVEALA